MEPQKVAAQNEQCACEFRAISTPISAKISPRTENGSHSLVSTIVVNERGTAGPEAHRFDRTEEYVVAANRSYLNDAAIERDHGRDQYGAAGRERQPISAPPSPNVLTQNTPFSTTTGLVWLRRLRHMSNMGGASETEQTAVAVAPALPPGPAVVMTWTAAPSRLIPSRKSSGSTVRTGS